MTDRDYMQIALDLAKKGYGWVNPNPLVGAVIVKNGRIIGQGYHKCYGKPHAEQNALTSLTEPAADATLYVTLEPCCHWGKSPPCTDAIIESKFKKVVIGSKDPNPLVAGNGIRILKDHGIEVIEGVLKDACDQLNEVFFHFMKTRRPYVVMKYAMTMDGKIATTCGKSKWITNERSREHVQHTRNRCAGIMVGINTVLMDDPLLNCRLPGGKNPIRIICDSKLRTPLQSKIILTADNIPTIIATCCKDHNAHTPYLNAGCTVLVVPPKQGQIDLNSLMEQLGDMNIDSILLEGGAALNWSALESGIVNKVQTYIAPKLFGGALAKGPVSGIGVELPQDAIYLSRPAISWLGDDILLESEVLVCSQEL